MIDTNPVYQACLSALFQSPLASMDMWCPERLPAVCGLNIEDDGCLCCQRVLSVPQSYSSESNLDFLPDVGCKDCDHDFRQAAMAETPRNTITTLYNSCHDALPQQNKKTLNTDLPVGSSGNPPATGVSFEAAPPGSLLTHLSPRDSALDITSCSFTSNSSRSNMAPGSYNSYSSSMYLVDDLDDIDQQQKQSAGGSCRARQAAVGHTQSGILQDLSVVASHRKGYAALNPAHGRSCAGHVAAATDAGSHSVKARLVVTEVSLYCNDMVDDKCWSNSPLALEQANNLMTRMTLPDAVTYMPVTSDSWIFQAAASLQFPSFVICLGSSYLQRMLATLPELSKTAAAVPEFEKYCNYLPTKAQPADPHKPLSAHELAATKATMRIIHFTCLFLALKVADQVHAPGLLRYIMIRISDDQRLVTLDAPAAVEAWCLAALGWRLGPWFGEADLTGNDEELWAAAMGSQEYGTMSDCWY